MMKKVRILIVFIFFISLFACAFGQEVKLKLHFIDVGEGDSILIETPEGENILVDTGNLITGYKVVEYLKQNKIQALDYLILTHPDLDHIGGAFFVLQMLKVKNIYDNGQNLDKHFNVYRWYEELVRRNKNYKILRANDTISLSSGELTLKVLWPPQSFFSSDFNTNSLVIMLKYEKFRCLLTGDLSITGEREILKEKGDLKADVLKVGHHGANDANSEEFLMAVAPQIAILSVNRANIRGYPAEEVISRLRKIGTQLHRTDKHGDIVVTIYPSKHKDFKIKVNEIR